MSEELDIEKHRDYIVKKLMREYNIKEDDKVAKFGLEACFNMSTSLLTYGDIPANKERYLYNEWVPSRELADKVYEYVSGIYLGWTPINEDRNSPLFGYRSSKWKKLIEFDPSKVIVENLVMFLSRWNIPATCLSKDELSAKIKNLLLEKFNGRFPYDHWDEIEVSFNTGGYDDETYRCEIHLGKFGGEDTHTIKIFPIAYGATIMEEGVVIYRTEV